eukprot:TRINITY_DN4841_c0_g1_i4.p1 TRINITY_DN4841_c0_g1~~TRINITY_DN4841_c0_g1_i4.p1  ORF type:complete len:281 (+),score=24.25 TRINITY_DN4841_c0_g1_i4:352-1194(+)
MPGRKADMSSLTNYAVRIKPQYDLPPCAKPAQLVSVQHQSTNLDTELEDAVLAELDSHASADDDSLINMGSFSRSDHNEGRADAETAQALPVSDPWISAASAITGSLAHRTVQPDAAKLGMLKYKDDEEKLLAFCSAFESLREVFGGKGVGQIASALFRTDADAADESTWAANGSNALIDQSAAHRSACAAGAARSTAVHKFSLLLSQLCSRAICNRRYSSHCTHPDVVTRSSDAQCVNAFLTLQSNITRCKSKKQNVMTVYLRHDSPNKKTNDRKIKDN